MDSPAAHVPRTAQQTLASGFSAVAVISTVGPLAIYLVLHFVVHLSDVTSLLIGAVVSVAANAYTIIRRHTLDTRALLVLVELVISTAILLITHDARVLLYRPAVLIGAAGLYVLLTCVWRRPLIYHTMLVILIRGDQALAAVCERLWRDSAGFRLRLRLLTALWGAAFLIDAATRAYLAATSSITKALVLPHVIDPVLFLIVVLVTVREYRQIKQLVSSSG